ncbi:PAS domain S-box protein [Nocardiopsis baichengensis]|uniref:PAS domain S-box protein n=1 Tax=Nocardiopsis baichengensis TaxID=280240 RepID=UPI000344BBC2|nr:PAS domain S-box protein [Nocardiopsis baichengensis]
MIPDGLELSADAVLASCPDAMVAVDARLRVAAWNPAAERLFGWSAAETLGRPAPMVPSELLAEEHAVLERARAGGPVSILTRRLRRDGTAVDVRVDTGPLHGADGARAGWLQVFRRDGDHGELRSHAAERARLVRRLTDVAADINADLDLGAVLDRIARSLAELTGADAGGFALIEGDRLRLVSLSGLSEHLKGYTAPLESSLFGELLRSGRSVLLATDDNGSLDDLIWADLDGLHTIALGVSSVQGRPYGALYALYSGRRVGHVELELLELLAAHAGVALGNAMAYQEMVRRRAKEHAVVESSADGIAVLDGRGRVRKWNRAAAELTGVAPARAAGRPPPFPLPEGEGESVRHRLPGGRWVEILVTGIGGTEERVVDFRDITQAKELEEEKDLFMATAGHELRTPVTVVQGFAGTLVQRWEQLDDAARKDAVRTIAERSSVLARLVENLLLGAAAEGDLRVGAEEFDLRRLLDEAAGAFSSFSARHTLRLEAPDRLPAALGDPVATDVIVGQLLENAFKYSPDGGSVRMVARADGGLLVVDVEDEGVGIAPGDEERIFGRFVQGDAGDRRRFGGIGLGLYIVRRLARAQGGDVTADSRPIGARMRLTLHSASSRDGAADDSAGEGGVSVRTASRPESDAGPDQGR